MYSREPAAVWECARLGTTLESATCGCTWKRIRWSGEARLMLLRSDGYRQFGADKGGDVYAELEGLRPRTVWPQNPNMHAGSKARITRKGPHKRPHKPIEGFNRILNQFRLRQCVKQLEKEERGQKNIPEQSRIIQKASKRIEEKRETICTKEKLECKMVEDIDGIPDITITIDEDKTNETSQKKLKRFDENTLATVKDLIKEFNYHKALELLDSFIKKDENKGRVQIDPSAREKQLQKLFPLPKQTHLKLNFRPYQKQFFTFSENEIFEAVINTSRI
ncbi:Hypothetical_protein [Hexamita inflata]|uniref:Hypothetical_protein n=1 Tax=Hexamita inflata TaxID=28002 RepID=A0AA86TQX2_9EUKA|nr:Hypothetical protein HINF_LOCUS12690 [Hexamita inflata]CAI9968236.1 Hypothetical protein HINF_LOCUS55881 [Hexamita inflata]